MTSNAASRQTIADHYRRMILAGQLADGAPLPGVLDIAQEHGVSKDMVTRALRILQSDGLIRVGRRGALVSAGDVTPTEHQAWPAVGCRILPVSDGIRVIGAELVPAPKQIASELQIEPLAPVARRTQVHLQDKLPVLYTVTWFQSDLVKSAPELMSRRPVDTDKLIRETTGRPATRGFDEICARGATVEIAREFGIGEGAPLLAGFTRYIDDGGSTIEVIEFFIPADRRLAFAHNAG